MLWPFKRPADEPASMRGTIESIYGAIVAQARDATFYRSMDVPDTVEGRFDMLVLHLWLVMQPLREGEAGQRLAQMLFDRFCSDMDANLREMGVGDLTVPKRMHAFGQAFYGRSAAYDAALAKAPDDLADALARNVLNSNETERARPLAAYVRQARMVVSKLDVAALQTGGWRFPSPEVAS